MLKPFGLLVVVSDAAISRVTIVKSPTHMVTLSTLIEQISVCQLPFQEINGKATALSGPSERSRYATKVSRSQVLFKNGTA